MLENVLELNKNESWGYSKNTALLPEQQAQSIL